ncbi:hypothetical protein NEOLEDRAFT_251464 [Neolentinus lepideus HHB14362 ss-1]|uniref:Uncharacterized protein n=1 Tax=Neolentinus lepideus HHB14362 ss-1 TaxID=1314782 RepID=A0A165T9G8_9AGAM|nr:hypothetical protein NEOLEDRAFT_251464 [Neolentinus lepideus HHB14362 ss-1]
MTWSGIESHLFGQHRYMAFHNIYVAIKLPIAYVSYNAPGTYMHAPRVPARRVLPPARLPRSNVVVAAAKTHILAHSTTTSVRALILVLPQIPHRMNDAAPTVFCGHSIVYYLMTWLTERISLRLRGSATYKPFHDPLKELYRRDSSIERPAEQINSNMQHCPGYCSPVRGGRARWANVLRGFKCYTTHLVVER